MNSFIIKKLKEGRVNAKLKQSEVAEKIGIKGNTLSNYENGVSEPDIDTFCALCDIYGIDPSSILNEAYGLGVQGEDFKIKPSEIEHIKKYRDLDDHGKEMVDFVLNREYERAQQPVDGQISLLPIDGYIQIFRNGHREKYQKVEETDSNVNAAHAINNASEEDKKHDENILDEENF